MITMQDNSPSWYTIIQREAFMNTGHLIGQEKLSNIIENITLELDRGYMNVSWHHDITKNEVTSAFLRKNY